MGSRPEIKLEKKPEVRSALWVKIKITVNTVVQSKVGLEGMVRRARYISVKIL